MNLRVRRPLRHFAALALASLGLITATVSPALAAETDPADQWVTSTDGSRRLPVGFLLTSACHYPNMKCSYGSPVKGEAYLTDYKQVSDSLWNCSADQTSTKRIRWDDTVKSSVSIGGSLTLSQSAGAVFASVTASVKASYSHTWEEAYSTGSDAAITVKPGYVGWISRAQVLQPFEADVTVSESSSFRPWQSPREYKLKVGVDYPDDGSAGQAGRVVVSSRKMTPEEQVARCDAAGSDVVSLPKP
ncbi:hypothetical protein [Amycolatopsis sp. SID8362]|uniref:hypothetical protein n=1 Tax=Amycolatopsis sp. SID8362 TaxID=2690346 RepID=UPI001368D62A|nr:hypothetical protein [Amycolatopsis sp. SID8362]NBH04623.1 hypothetical protein [Amycolatopsis sp. SID8362]NED41322.1 hypothetical protein [Amycolatopsis sp. SID8362]